MTHDELRLQDPAPEEEGGEVALNEMVAVSVHRHLLDAALARAEAAEAERDGLREAASAVLGEFDDGYLRPVATYAQRERLTATKEALGRLRECLMEAHNE